MAPDELLTSRVRRKLLVLKGLLRAHLLGRGLCWLIVAAVAAVFVTLGIDLLLHMDRAQRGLIGAMALGGIGYVVWRFLLRPMRVPMNAEELALVLEARYPQLDDRLISALQFAQRPQSRAGASEAMIRTMARQANAVAAELDARAVVAASGTWRRMVWPVAALMLLTAFTALNGELMGLWFRRNVLFENVRWPQQTYLTLPGGSEYSVIRGGTLELVVTAEGKLPDHVTFHMRFASLSGEVREAVAATTRGGNEYVKKTENVSEGFSFYVTGNDGRTGRCRVVVVNPPELVSLDGTKQYPHYMNRDPGRFSPTSGMIAIPPGSSIFFTGKADKDLKSACLRLDGEKVADLDIKQTPAHTGDEDAGRPRVLEGVLRLPERIEQPAMLLDFELTDTEDVTNPRGASYSLRIEQDRAPALTVSPRHVRGDVTAQAMIPLEIEARDDCGVTALGVSLQPLPAEAEATPPEPTEFAVEGFQTDEKDIRAEHTADLRPLGLKEGDRIRIQGVARDTLPPSFGGPNVSRSVIQTFKIVSEAELMAELLRRWEEVSQDFARTVMLQGEVRVRVEALGERLESAKEVDVETGRRLGTAAADQGRIARQCAIAGQQLQSVLDEMICNRVGVSSGKTGDLESIVTDLADLAKKTMPDVAKKMADASKLTDLQAVRGRVAESAGELAALEDALKKIQKRMHERYGREYLANETRILIDRAKKILAEMDKLSKGRAGEVFEDEDEPKP